MRSASASAALTIDSACARWSWGASGRPAPAGCGGSWWNAKPWSAGLDELLIVVVLRAPDHERAGVLELANHGDYPALGLLDDAAALRRLELDLLHQHLGAALRHVPHDLVLHF